MGRTVRTFFAMASVAAAVAAGATTAHADPASAMPSGAAPNCVDVDLTDGRLDDYVWVTNYCPYRLRLKVVLAFATDKPCDSYEPNTGRLYYWSYPGRFDGVVTC
ncbi:hypothetical protein [Amycolatopsis viridis]|uniref:Secreted protein n=1 Tax=Amycolatopsis viridis TaxID=185678 RepID=A0ABX0T181_9PSEU|nr:hypothetical protein [Amycolatopsis viridis]NIH81610.1 hypothetical protein [Amycolatopsis viridis]